MKQIAFRIESEKLQELDIFLIKKGISKQFIFNKFIALLLENKLEQLLFNGINDNEVRELREKYTLLENRLQSLIDLMDKHNSKGSNDESIPLEPLREPYFDNVRIEEIPSEIKAGAKRCCKQIAVNSKYTNKELIEVLKCYEVTEKVLSTARSKNDFSLLPKWFSSAFKSQGSGVNARWVKVDVIV